MDELIMRSVTVVTMNLLCIYWMKQVYPCKKRTIFPCISLLMVISLLGMPIDFLQVPWLNLLYMLLTIHILSFYLFEESAKKMIVINTLYVLLVLFGEMFSVWISVLVGIEKLYDILYNNQPMLIASLINLVVMCVSSKIFALVISKKKKTNIKMLEIIMQLLFCLLALFVLYCMIEEATVKEDGIKIIIVIIGFAILDIFMAFILGNISEMHQINFMMQVLKEENVRQLEYYKTLNEETRYIRKIEHDIKNHMYVMDRLRGEELREYGESLLKDIQTLVGEFTCTNPILSIVMGQKILEAEKEGILLELHVMDLKLEFMADLDVTSLFSNLWDNAMEATRLLAPDKRKITVILGEEKGCTIINFSNTYNGCVQRKQNQYLSTKPNHMGLGMRIMKEIIQKYEGTFQCDEKDETFHVGIVIPRC